MTASAGGDPRGGVACVGPAARWPPGRPAAETTISGSPRPVSPSNSTGASARSTNDARPRRPAPVTAAVPSARIRNCSARSASPSRRASRAQEHRGQVGADQHGQHAARGRGRVEPARHHVPGGDAGRHPAGGDAAGHGAEEERRDHRGERERGAEEALQRKRRDALAERERRAPRAIMPKRRQRQRDVQRRGDRRERRRERGPQHDEHEDQPDVVGLPHRADRVLDQVALRACRAGCRRRAGPRSRRRSRRRRTARTA